MGAKIIPVNWADAEHCSDIAVTSEASASYAIENLQSNLRGSTWRATNLDTQSITGTFDGNVRPCSAWGLFPELPSAPGAVAPSLIGATVRMRHWSDVAKTTLVYDSGTLDFFTATGEGYGDFPYGAHPWGVAAGDLTCRLAPKVRFHSEVASSAWQLDIANAGGVDTSFLAARRLVIGDYVEAPYNALLGAAPKWATNSQHQRQIGAGLQRLVRGRWRELNCEIPLDSEEHRRAWSDICHAIGTDQEIVFSLFEESDGERLFRDFIVLGSLEVMNPHVWDNVDFHKLQLAIVES